MMRVDARAEDLEQVDVFARLGKAPGFDKDCRQETQLIDVVRIGVEASASPEA